MKHAFISDIHGNYHALEAVLEDIRSQQADRIYVLGDLVFKGPLPERCIQTVRRLNATAVLQGNIDELVGKEYIQPGFAKSAQHEADLRRELAWTRCRLSTDELDYLAKLPFSYEAELAPGLGLKLVHANPENLLDMVLPTDEEERVLARMFQGTDARLVIYGHIHQPYVRFIGGRAVVNTGSVGLPFDGNPAASYAIVETEDTGVYGEPGYSVAIRRVPYDLAAALAAFEGSDHPFPESVSAALKAGRRPV